MFGAFYGSKLELYCGNCIYAVIGLRLLWTLNNFLEQRLWDAKFHHNYSYSSSSKTRQVTCFRRYSGDTRRYPKNEKQSLTTNPPHHFKKKHISKVQKDKTQHNPIPQWNWHKHNRYIPNLQDAGKKIHDQKHVFQNTTWTEHAPTSRNRSPELNATKQRMQFPHGVSWT